MTRVIYNATSSIIHDTTPPFPKQSLNFPFFSPLTKIVNGALNNIVNELRVTSTLVTLN